MVKKCKVYGNWCHCRERPASQFDRRSIRTKMVKKGVQLVVGCPKGKFKNGRCKAGMRTLSRRYSRSYLAKHHKRCK